MKIIDKINALAPGEPYFSFEYFPPRTAEGRTNLMNRIQRMSRMEPLWVDMTWPDVRVRKITMQLCAHMSQHLGCEVMMHLTCTNLTRDVAKAVLDEAKAAGVMNILALRGDTPLGVSVWTPIEGGFAHAADLVAFIRAEYGDYFGIGVAGHPEGHPAGRKGGETREAYLGHLKAKVDAGADLVVTQLFYDTETVISFIRDCRAAGIACPVVPGIMPIQNFRQFVRMTNHCKVKVDQGLMAKLEPIKQDDAAVKLFGVEVAAGQVRRLLATGLCQGVHFYTLNLERSVTRIVNTSAVVEDVPAPGAPRAPVAASTAGSSAVGAPAVEGKTSDAVSSSTLPPLIPVATSTATGSGSDARPAPRSLSAVAHCRRRLPWRPSQMQCRAAEDVRPIFWANRPESYVERTAEWDDFPNGRWGDSRSPAWGDLSAVGAQFVGREDSSRWSVADRRAMWGERPLTVEDVYAVFAGYIEGRVKALPWCDQELQLETGVIRDRLITLNARGILTINSQPRVCCAQSDDPTFGWGGAGGVVYQKAYLEFFISPKLLSALMQNLESFPSLTFHAVDIKGNTYTNAKTESACAVTWGVFPNKEILQPTVVDPAAFLVWKDEAFALWTELWAKIYPDGGESTDLIHTVADTFFLVNIVDNNFVSGDIFRAFDFILEQQ